ncbi:acyl carrier protein [Aquiflexum lacus]|uniref:acyl carrier protein n=1 Tax=Aquiflexum lacus TaxID=2483805 RepID=UPI0018942AC7|nr:acyl carrier protein [Aquiflexum lacus]
MKTISNMKKAISVFKTYGIPLTGKRKSANFYKELQMDKMFVDGLIFELEYELKRELEDEKISKIETPSELIEHLLSA